MSGIGDIQFEDCSDELQRIIKSTEGAVGFFKRTELVTTETDKVILNFLFHKDIDLLFVFKDSTYIEINKDYTISTDSGYIQSVGADKWKGTTENPIEFNFLCFKAIPLDNMRIDGRLIYDGTINISKMDADFITQLQKMLRNFYTKSEIDTKLSNIQQQITIVQNKTSHQLWVQYANPITTAQVDDIWLDLNLNVFKRKISATAWQIAGAGYN